MSSENDDPGKPNLDPAQTSNGKTPKTAVIVKMSGCDAEIEAVIKIPERIRINSTTLKEASLKLFPEKDSLNPHTTGDTISIPVVSAIHQAIAVCRKELTPNVLCTIVVPIKAPEVGAISEMRTILKNLRTPYESPKREFKKREINAPKIAVHVFAKQNPMLTAIDN